MTTFQISHDPDVDSVYLKIGESPIAKTIELKEFVFADLDENGKPIGIEFVNASDFFSFMSDYNGTIELPETLFSQGEKPVR